LRNGFPLSGQNKIRRNFRSGCNTNRRKCRARMRQHQLWRRAGFLTKPISDQIQRTALRSHLLRLATKFFFQSF